MTSDDAANATVGAIWRGAARRLNQSPTPMLDARVLAAHCLFVDETGLVMIERDTFPPERQAAFDCVVERRAAGEPIARIIGAKEFYGRVFTVTPSTLVPRPETEMLVSAALSLVANDEAPLLADLGTGTGCIAVTLAAERADARVIAIDRSWGAIETAAANARRYEVAERVGFLVADWMQALAPGFDAIVANPPYIGVGEADSLSRDVRDYDPTGALFAGPDGLDAYRIIVPHAAQRLRGGGHLVVEIGAGQAMAVTTLLGEAGFTSIRVDQDLAGADRLVYGQWRGG